MRNHSSRILIAGSYGHGNTGDEAILSVMVDQFRARIPDARIVVVAGDTETIRQQFGVETVAWDDWAAIAQAVEQSDMVIQGGGGIFFDYTGFHPLGLFENGAPDLSHYGGFSLLAELYGKPFMVYGVGVGPLLSDDGRQMVRLAHLLADAITVRDAESKSLLEEAGVEPSRVEVTADPAFSLLPTDASRARKILTDHGINLKQPLIAITPRPWSYLTSEANWEGSLADAVSAFAAAKKAQVLLIPFQKGYDDGPVSLIQGLLADSDTFVLRGGYTAQEVAGVIGLCDLLIGLRLHSVLFAILTATPAVALAYDPKLRSLTRRIGHEEICIDLTEVSQLKDLLADVWERREELSSDFAKARSEMRLLSERNTDLACALLDTQVSSSVSYPEFRDMLAKAFYGRLQAIRVRDRVIAKQDETKELQDIIDIMKAEQWPPPSQSFGMDDSDSIQLLREFLQRAITESATHLLTIYDTTSMNRQVTGLAEAFADYGIPTVLICESEQSAAPANHVERSGKVFRLSVAAMVTSWDEVLYASTPPTCQRILLLRSADQNTFRLVNHAHALGWVTMYYPPTHEQSRQDLEAERYIVSNVECVIVGSATMKDYMQSIGAKQVRSVAGGENANDQARELMDIATDGIQKSPMQLAIEGAGRG